MKRFWSYCTRMLSRLLEPGEREIALGDVAELGLVGAKGFASMLGLVLRRQLQPWKHWRSWFVLVALVIPIAVLLASFCNELGGKLFPVVVMWSHHRVAYATGLQPSAEVFGLLFSVAALVVGSWSCGFAVGAVSRVAMYAHSVGFCVILLAMGWGLGPISLVVLWMTAWGWLPVGLTCLLVLAPAYYGVREGAASSRMRMQRLVLLAAMTAVVGVLAMWTRGWDGAAMENWSHGGAPLNLIQLAGRGDCWEGVSGHLVSLFVFASPTLYLGIETFWHSHGQPGVAIGEP